MNLPLTIVVGDTDSYLGQYAKTISADSYLVDSTNVAFSHSGVIYTSLGDINDINSFFNLLSTADRLIYYPPKIWEDKKTKVDTFSTAWLTEHYLLIISTLHNIPIENKPAPIIDIDYSIIKRKTNNKQLWVTGCSTTFGSGVSNNERYWEIVKKEIGLDATVLAAVGASNAWCRDQILKCDIAPGDIVIWGLTSKDRFSWVIDNKLKHITPYYYSRHPEFDNLVSVDTLGSPQRLHETLSSIQQVINFATTNKVHLIIASLHGDIDVASEAIKYKEFLLIHGKSGLMWNSNFLDFGTDGLHPGPKTHKMYASTILEKLTQLTL